jgi:hypothetical protein
MSGVNDDAMDSAYGAVMDELRREGFAGLHVDLWFAVGDSSRILKMKVDIDPFEVSVGGRVSGTIVAYTTERTYS